MNFREAYTEYAAEITDAPEKYHRWIAYAVASCAVNRNVWMANGHKRLYSNLYMNLIGPSTINRKSFAVNYKSRRLERGGKPF